MTSSQLTESIGAQLPWRTAWTTADTATSPNASPAMTWKTRSAVFLLPLFGNSIAGPPFV